jgi:hypothetical protein
VLQQRLLAIRSNCAITAVHDSAVAGAAIDLARDVDLLVTCVDHDAPRLAAALLANRFLKVHLDVATGIHRRGGRARDLAGDVRLLLPHEGCLCCVGGLGNADRAREELLGIAPPAGERPWHAERAGSLITLNTLAVSIGVQLWLDLLSGHLRHSCWHRLEWAAGQGLRVDAGLVTGSPDCPIHSGPRARRSSV